jgi:hypothetical protein
LYENHIDYLSSWRNQIMSEEDEQKENKVLKDREILASADYIRLVLWIAVMAIPDTPGTLGEAINDRLRRASLDPVSPGASDGAGTNRL